jgi:hypothetical protein
MKTPESTAVGAAFARGDREPEHEDRSTSDLRSAHPQHRYDGNDHRGSLTELSYRRATTCPWTLSCAMSHVPSRSSRSRWKYRPISLTK